MSAISVSVAGRLIDLRTLIFSGGEVQPRLSNFTAEWPPEPKRPVKIVAHLWSSDAIMELLLVTNALRHHYGAARIKIDLICPYLPYARQDRVCYPGEANSLEVIASLLSDQCYDSIELWDVHNTAAIWSLLKGARSTIYRKASWFMSFLPMAYDATVVVAPDAGAVDRALSCATALYAPLVKATKTRNPETGELGAPSVETEHIGPRDFLVVDDICDGGRTFVNLAKVLRPLTEGKLYLYVTHGIFSAGYNDLRAAYDHIYVANIHPQAGAPADLVTVIGALPS